MLAICTNTSPNLVLPFTVYECSNYADKHKPDWQQMEKLAINIQPVRVSEKTRGFCVRAAGAPANEALEEEGEEEVVSVAVVTVNETVAVLDKSGLLMLLLLLLLLWLLLASVSCC